MDKVFNDPIHGHIELHPLLVKIIDTPQFQRLRNIKQLGGGYFVYPGASHNRFEHSIGVAHLAGELAKALKTKQLEDLKELEKKMKELPQQTMEQEKLEQKRAEHLKLKESLITDRDILCVQIAGLCHDLGHGPFSHVFEGLFNPEADPADDKWKHEKASIAMFDDLLDDKLKTEMKRYELEIEGDSENDLTFIREMIYVKDDQSQDEWPYKGRNKEKSFLYEIVSNKQNGIDVDKFDYFARDCHHLGIQNSFDHRRFIVFAKVCDVDGKKHICSRDKEITNLCNMFHTRESLHRGAYQHWVKVAVEIMIKDALIKASKNKDFEYLCKAKNDMKAYIKLTDHVIEEILDHGASSSSNESTPESTPFLLAEAASILQRIKSRDLYQFVGEIKVKEKDQQTIEEIKKTLKKELAQDGKEDEQDIFEITEAKFYYGKKNKDSISNYIYFYRKYDSTKGFKTPKEKVSSLLPVCHSETAIRVYWKKSDPESLKNANERFRAAVELIKSKIEDPNAEQNISVDNPLLEKINKKHGDNKALSKVFNDPIHAHIELHPLLVKIIDTPQFQRLRNIKQLGGVYFVYPGASHNRFEHSIGVAHLAGELAKALKTKQLEDLKELEKKMEKIEKELKDLEKKLKELPQQTMEQEKLDQEKLEQKRAELLEYKQLKLKESLINDQDILCVQIAGLCHDLGHGPFSHLFDGMFIPEVTKASKEDKDDKWTHEKASLHMFEHLLKENGLEQEMEDYGLKVKGEDKRDLKFIQELFYGPLKKNADQKEWPYEGRNKEKSFLYEIASNKQNGIDVDKFDYFARDCHHLGIRNNFDHQRFIIFARVCKVNEWYHICSRDKEVANLYDLFHTRHSLHRRACQHKIKMAVEIMIKDALLKADQTFLFQAIDDMEAYTKLTDQVIETILNSHSPGLKESKKILQRVMTRDLYQCVGQATKKDQVQISEDMKESLKRKLLRDIPDSVEDNFEITVVTLDYGMKDKDPISKAYFYRKNNPKKGIPISKSKVSKLLPEHFSEEILRVYWKTHENTEGAKIYFKTWCKENGFEVEEEHSGIAC